MITKYGNGAVVQIATVFEPVYYVACQSSEKSFYFRNNCVPIGCVKLCLLRREYWSSAVNVLTNTYKALHLTKTDSFRLNYLQHDH